MRVSFIKQPDVEHEVLGFNVVADKLGDKEKIKRMLNAVFIVVINERTNYGIKNKKVTILINIENPG